MLEVRFQIFIMCRLTHRTFGVYLMCWHGVNPLDSLRGSSVTHDKKPHPASTISEQLREVIRRRGLTAYKVAKDAGLSHTVVQRFLDGERGLKLDSADKLAQTLRLRLTEDPTIFTMTICKPNNELLTKGESLSGENWSSALLRLLQKSLGDGIGRQVQTYSQWEVEKAQGKAHVGVARVDVVRVDGPREGMSWPVEHFLIETDPPQILGRRI
jgi:transcriptional regulator with XRE-family HTH domain